MQRGFARLFDIKMNNEEKCFKMSRFGDYVHQQAKFGDEKYSQIF